MAAKQGQGKGKKNRKLGRNKVKCARYRVRHRSDKKHVHGRRAFRSGVLCRHRVWLTTQLLVVARPIGKFTARAIRIRGTKRSAIL